MVQSSHDHKRIHGHCHGLHGVHKQVHIQHREQLGDEGRDQHVHIHAHNRNYGCILCVDNHVCEHIHVQGVHTYMVDDYSHIDDHKRNEQIGLETNLYLRRLSIFLLEHIVLHLCKILGQMKVLALLSS